MSNILVIMKRDLKAYFTSPIGYIFMMVFVTLSVGLYITQFFIFPTADMRPYFENLPLLLCVFIPAVTMRVWAEERNQNTWEMLLTFPMKAQELVLGKFIAGLIFFGLTLIATWTVPAMLINLGDPDTGQIVAGYLGTLLLGAFLLALGIFLSGFFRDQIVAFVVALLTAFLFFLLGTDFIAAYIDSRVPGLGGMLSNLLGFFSHYNAFIRGVVDLADIVYFVAWTAIFLVLNVLYIDGRNRPGARAIFAGAAAMSIAIGLLFNYLMTGASLFRVDLTEDKLYTISDATEAILEELDTPAQVKVYITPQDKMPTQLRSLEQDITDKLEELRVATNGAIDFTTIHLEVANVIADQQPMNPEEEGEEGDDEKSIETRMLDKGVEPFSVSALGEDEVTQKMIYSSIGVAYKDKPEEIITPVMPQAQPGVTSVQELEYKIVSSVYKMMRDSAPKVAMVAPKEAMKIDPQMRQMLMQMGQDVPQQDDPYVYLEQILRAEKYEVERVELTRESPLPAEYDTLVVVNPRDLNERQRWEIARALHSGKDVVMAVQQYEWQYQPSRNGVSITRKEENPNINELLEAYGLKVSEDVLMEKNTAQLNMQLDIFRSLPLNLPMHILVNEQNMSSDVSITNRLSTIFYLWGTGLELDDAKLTENGLDAKVVMTTSESAWTVPSNTQLTQADMTPPAETRSIPLMAVVEGQFPDPFAGEERPAWPKPEQQPGMPPEPEMPEDEEEPAKPVAAAEGKLVLMGCSQLFRKNFMQDGNLDLFLNSVDAVTLDERLVQVRSRKPTNRSIDKPDNSTRTAWRLANYGLANIVIAGIGIGVFAMRRRNRNAYTMDQIKQL